ncbi:uncharacterized protein LOC112574238 isoform X4 [Pomacea canaliculata]|uniref:uncharacterized protein LOC112574238 isoform X4 n=1 Tax=Pomacea canaliculata TaxID=400727 RepID=UPI000D73A546|nr:uncharacterized protein LOC112574238 isoform X4 [Pomacea canaliculata]
MATPSGLSIQSLWKGLCRKTQPPSMESVCMCGLPNEKFCMLNLHSCVSSAGHNGRRRYKWVPMSICSAYSSSTSTVPLSSSELFYGNELSHHEFTEDITTGDTVTFDRERDKQKLKELDVGNRHMINRGGINRKAANFDKVTYDYEREEQHPVGNSVSSLKQFPLRTNGLKNNSLRGEQYFNHRNSAGREDDLVAMGTLWSPGQAQTRSSYISTSSCKSSNGTCTSSAATTTGTLPIRRSLNLSTSCSTRQLLTSSTSQPNATAFALSSMGNVKSSREVEPRYADPLAGAPSLFQQRLMELAALEAETVRWEKAKKVKKKSKQDS